MVTREANSKLFPRKNVNTKRPPVRQTCKLSMNFLRRKRAAACFLTAIGPVVTKTADRKTIMNYHTRGQTRKTIIDYHEEFEQAQIKLNDSWWYSMIVHDSWWSNGSARSTVIDYNEPFDQGVCSVRDHYLENSSGEIENLQRMKNWTAKSSNLKDHAFCHQNSPGSQKIGSCLYYCRSWKNTLGKLAAAVLEH